MIKLSLARAGYDLQFLLDRAYPKSSALEFVGNRYQLEKQERMILYRALFPKNKVLLRKAKLVKLKDFKGNRVILDGYNITITLESALKNNLMIFCNDSFVRDISGVFRKFRPSPLTEEAWNKIGTLLKNYSPREIVVVFDSPMSQSGQFAKMVWQWLKNFGLNAIVELSKTPERSMLEMKGIHCSADSFILDKAESVFDLAGHIIKRHIKNVNAIYANALTRPLPTE